MGFFLTIFVFFSVITFSIVSRKVSLLERYPCIFESPNVWVMSRWGFGGMYAMTLDQFKVNNLKMLLFGVKIWSFCRGTEMTNLTRNIHCWTLIKKPFIPWATSIQIMTFMHPTWHRTFFEDQKWSFYMSPIKILSWKMIDFTPFFCLLVWITYWWWTLNPYKVYIFWKLHVLGIFCIESYSWSIDTEDVGFFSECTKWNVTKILKCVLFSRWEYQERMQRGLFPW